MELTEADQRAYTRLAQAQRHKGFEQVLVRFGRSPLQEARERGQRPRAGRGPAGPGSAEQVAGQQDGGGEHRDRGDGVLDARPGAEQP